MAAALLIGGLIGIERSFGDHPAGLRTHILVCTGATLIMIISLDVPTRFFGLTESDPARIAAQVVSGIGFLGAGTILREGATVRGLTTAASLWITAALGLAVGAGLYLEAGVGLALTLITLHLLYKLEVYLAVKRARGQLVIVAEEGPGLLGEVAGILGNYRINITGVEFGPKSEARVRIRFDIQVPSGTDTSDVIGDIVDIPRVKEVSMEDERH
ncbi:MAG: MgtC/SapB family protein [Bacillota bacterium]